MSLLISSDKLISSSDARKSFGKLLKTVSSEEGEYFVILENGKIRALLVSPDWIEERSKETFPSLGTIRKSWDRNEEAITEALENLVTIPRNKRPPLLQ